MADVLITRYPRGFSVDTSDYDVKRELEFYNESLIQPKLAPSRGQIETVEGDRYFVYEEAFDRYYYIDALYDQLINVLDNIKKRLGVSRTMDIVVRKVEPHDGDVVEFDRHTLNIVEPEDSPFVYQNDIVPHASRDGFHHNILEIQTGLGKTAMAMKTIVNIKRRVLFITKAAYIEKWIGDLTAKKFSLSLRPGELVRIKNLQDFDNIVAIGEAGRLGKAPGEREVKMIAISSHTLDNWLQESLKRDKSCHFTDLLKTLGVGLVLYDETHQLFRMNYWSFMLLGAPRVLDLSATLGDEGDAFMDARYAERVPKAARYNGLEYDAYIDAYSLYFHTENVDLINRMNRMKMYNHTEFEKAIMRKKRIQQAYFKMVYDVMAAWYLKGRQPGQRCLVFFSTKKMCTEFTNYVKGLHPELDVQRYIQGDNYDVFVNADIGVSTPGKSSTAVDIKGLVISICTVAMGKEKANLQLLGRTRKVRDWDLTPRVVYFHCKQIAKHSVYLNRRQKMFQGKVKSFRTLNSQFWI